jgi:hypothetical protein
VIIMVNQMPLMEGETATPLIEIVEKKWHKQTHTEEDAKW